MTNCSGKNCSFGLLCVSFVNIYKFCMCPLPFGFKGRIWDFILLIPHPVKKPSIKLFIVNIEITI